MQDLAIVLEDQQIHKAISQRYGQHNYYLYFVHILAYILFQNQHPPFFRKKFRYVVYAQFHLFSPIKNVYGAVFN